MTTITLKKTLAGARPIDEKGEDVFAKIALGEEFTADVKRPRNIQHHRKFFALCKMVADNTDMVRDSDELVFRLKIATGHCRESMRNDGVVLYEPQSISFASMNQDEFNIFYDRCVDIICTHIIPGMSRAELQNEVLEMVA